MRKKIEVKLNHIKRGEKEMVDSCPIALALKDAFNNSNLCINVFSSYLTFYNKRPIRCHSIRLPHSARKFISKFDKSKDVKPFAFYLNLPKVVEKFTA